MTKRLLAFLFLAVAFLSGCSVSLISTDSEVTLSANENWKVHIEIVIPSDMVQLIRTTMSQQLDDSVQQFTAKGVHVTYKYDEPDSNGSVPLNINFQGQGYDLFNEMMNNVGSLEQFEKGGHKLIRVTLFDIAAGLQVENGRVVTISGGRIVETNGNKVNANTVQWVNSASMEVVMEEPRETNPLGITLIILGALFILFAVGWRLGWLRSKPHVIEDRWQSSSAGYPGFPDGTKVTALEIGITSEPRPVEPEFVSSPSEGRFCPNCGLSLSTQARFCTACGKKVD